jgi:hypothetical protein
VLWEWKLAFCTSEVCFPRSVSHSLSHASGSHTTIWESIVKYKSPVVEPRESSQFTQVSQRAAEGEGQGGSLPLTNPRPFLVWLHPPAPWDRRLKSTRADWTIRGREERCSLLSAEERWVQGEG